MAGDLTSLVICTRDRADSLGKCLAAIRSMVVPTSWELIIVDNGSRDATREVVEQYKAQVAFPVSYAQEPQPGLSRARNRGVAVASGDPLVFIDDDCYPEPDFLGQAIAIFASSRMCFFGGRVLLYDPDDYPITIKTSTKQELLSPGSYVEAGFIHGANMGCRRSVFEAVGGFNESLGAGTPLASGEDTEFLARASAAGFWGGYFPGPVVRHHHGRNEYDVETHRRGYDLGRGAYYAAMILRSATREQYLKHWWWSMSWTRRAAAFREFRGAAAFIVKLARARLQGRSFVPNFTPSRGRAYASSKDSAGEGVSG